MCICSASIRLIYFFAPLAVISNAQSTTTFDSGCGHFGQVSSKASLFKDSPCTFFNVWLFGWHSLTLPLPANPLLEVRFCRFWCYFGFNRFNHISFLFRLFYSVYRWSFFFNASSFNRKLRDCCFSMSAVCLSCFFKLSLGSNTWKFSDWYNFGYPI